MSLISSAITTLRYRGPSVLVRAGFNHCLSSIQHAFGALYVERPIHNYRMLLDLEDRGISRTLLLFGTREQEHKIMLERVLHNGMTVLDIGANIGYYALMELGLAGQEGTLIAVEPSPANVTLLRRNLELNGYNDIEIHEMAVSDTVGSRRFFLSHMSNLNTFHESGSGDIKLSGKSIEVKTTTVPSIMQGRKLDLMRMDAEGHEVEIINGLIPAVERGEMAPMILFETHLSRYGADHDMEAPLRRLFTLGYRLVLAGSSSQRGTSIVEAHGYKGSTPIPTDDVKRVIFEDIANDDAIDLICRTGGLRTVLLAR